MRTAERQVSGSVLMRMLACLLPLLYDHGADAHPVSQGAMELQIEADRISVLATVSPEEVIIAANGNAGVQHSFARALREHGKYLLAHLHIIADGKRLQGQVAAGPDHIAGRPRYDIEYPLGTARPSSITLQEDVLREVEFAPGNPWEASYLVRISHGREPPLAGLLLTFRQPLGIECRWRNDILTAVYPVHSLPLLAFVQHGVLHILTGYDHLLFVGALVLAIRGLLDLIKVISAFTLAHSITLTLAALDIFRLTGQVVEPMIAASIVAVAAQNVLWPLHSRGWGRIVVAFFFGLFHGLGFAGGLLDAMSSMQGASAAAAIASFSVGVELGQQIVVLPVFGALWLLRRQTSDAPRSIGLVQRYGSAAISLAGMFYLAAALRV